MIKFFQHPFALRNLYISKHAQSWSYSTNWGKNLHTSKLLRKILLLWHNLKRSWGLTVQAATNANIWHYCHRTPQVHLLVGTVNFPSAYCRADTLIPNHDARIPSIYCGQIYEFQSDGHRRPPLHCTTLEHKLCHRRQSFIRAYLFTSFNGTKTACHRRARVCTFFYNLRACV